MNKQQKNTIVKSLLRNGTRKIMALQAAQKQEIEAATQAGADFEALSQITASFEKQIADTESIYQNAAGKVEEGVVDDDMVNEMVSQSLEADRDEAIAAFEEFSENKRGAVTV